MHIRVKQSCGLHSMQMREYQSVKKFWENLNLNWNVGVFRLYFQPAAEEEQEVEEFLLPPLVELVTAGQEQL